MMYLSEIAEGRWCRFSAPDFDRDVVGVVYRAGQATCGLPLGAIGTGHIDLDTNGTFGRCTAFNTVIPPRQLGATFLGLAMGDDIWTLSQMGIEGTEGARQVHCWGHYPIAELEYEIDAPVAVGLRAWTPFFPGDSVGSNTPGAVFEVKLVNNCPSRQEGCVVMTFPGPSEEETDGATCSRQETRTEDVNGIHIQAQGRAAYFLGSTCDGQVRTGGDLNAGDGGWTALLTGLLPEAGNSDPGASVAVDFTLNPHQEEVIHFILAWYCPTVNVNGRHQYVHAYGPRFADAVQVARMLARNRESLLARIIAWQEVIFSEQSLPEWLRDCLVNNFHLLAEDSFWESNSVPPEDWSREHGMFSMVESTRTCPGQACIPSDWFGNLPIVYFFPELAHSTLRGFAHYQLPNGETPIYFGQEYERQNPVYQLLHLTSPCNFVDLVDRLWQRTGDKSVLYEFYSSVKLAVQYLKGLDVDADGIIDCQVGALGHQFYGLWPWHGAASHVAGMWLSVLSIAERMASAISDASFLTDCRVWRKMAEQTLESKLWCGNYYLLYNDVAHGRKDDTILGNQLAGLWSCRLHGVPDVFPADSITRTLQTVKDVCFPAARYGSATARRPDGGVTLDGGHQSRDIFLGECLILASTMLYAGEEDTGMTIARQLMETIVLKNGRAWDLPGFLDNDSGKPSFGNDFDQMMALWSLPAAIGKQTIAEAVSSGGFVDRIIRAAAGEGNPAARGGELTGGERSSRS